MSGGVLACPSCGTRNRLPASVTGRPRCASCHTDLRWIVDAGTGDFDRAVDTSSLVLVDLWAPWCGPCRMVAPAVEQVAAQRAGRLKVVKVNVDEAPEISARFGVQGIPTLLLLHRGELVAQRVGALPVDQLRAWVDQVAASTPTS